MNIPARRERRKKNSAKEGCQIWISTSPTSDYLCDEMVVWIVSSISSAITASYMFGFGIYDEGFQELDLCHICIIS